MRIDVYVVYTGTIVLAADKNPVQLEALSKHFLASVK